MTVQPPPAQGRRLSWSHLPEHLLAALEAWLDDTVVSATTQPGGFSPGIADRIRTSRGNGYFVKAAGPEPNADTPEIHRREKLMVGSLPFAAPVPRLLWSFDEGNGGWIVLVFEDVEGWSPSLPWLAEELNRVVDAMIDLSESLTPTPIQTTSAGEMFASNIYGWRLLAGEPTSQIDEWSQRHLPALASLEAASLDAVAGNTLVHFDVRADNILLTSDQVFFVDWPHASVGAAWVDMVEFAPSVTMQGGPQPEDVLMRHPAARAADPDAITAAIAALAGYFTWKATLPPPPGIPTVRAFQAAQGVVARKWLADRTGWK